MLEIHRRITLSPSTDVLLVAWRTVELLERLRALSDVGGTTIRDHRVAGGVHKDVRLVGCQYASGKTIKNDHVLP